MKNLIVLTICAVIFSVYTVNAATNDSIKIKKSQNPVSFNLNAGTSFMTGFNGMNAFSTFVAPQFNYPLSKRFVLNAGFAIVNTTFNSNYSGMNDGQKKSFSNNYTSTFIYGGGKYLLNERLTLSGIAYTEVGIFDNNKYQNKNYNSNIKGGSIGVDYKITENSSIGIHMIYSNGNSFGNFNNPYGMPNQNPFFGR